MLLLGFAPGAEAGSPVVSPVEFGLAEEVEVRVLVDRELGVVMVSPFAVTVAPPGGVLGVWIYAV